MQLKVGMEALPRGTNITTLEVPEHMRHRIATNLEWFDEVFIGGGVVPSQVVLLTGTPGAGKTTALMTLADRMTQDGHVCLYNSSEESGYQLKLTTERCGFRAGFIIGQDELVDDVIDHAKELISTQLQPGKHMFVIVDSLQTQNDGLHGAYINSMTGVRVAQKLIEFAKSGHENSAGEKIYPVVLIIGHVTKGGVFAGRNSVKHDCDSHAHLYICADKRDECFGEHIFELQKSRMNPAGQKVIIAFKPGGGIYKRASFRWE